MGKICYICKKPIGKNNWPKVRREFANMLEQVDVYGEESLSERQQVLYRECCHIECYYQVY